MSDFKTNEYANLLGGAEFEPKEGQPDAGIARASRYYGEGVVATPRRVAEAERVVAKEVRS